jgi:hypothetical protein
MRHEAGRRLALAAHKQLDSFEEFRVGKPFQERNPRA